MGTSRAWSRGIAAGFAILSLAPALPVRAETPINAALQSSENLRRLDIMLMVTGLRCRNTADDFQADFQAFEARHLPELNAAAQDMVAGYAAQIGADRANHLLDRLSVQMANRYGNGHPWLGCHELKGLTRSLAAQDGRAVLMQAASEVLDGDEPAPAIGAPVPAAGTPGVVIIAAK